MPPPGFASTNQGPPARAPLAHGDPIQCVKVGKDSKHYLFDPTSKSWLVKDSKDK